MSNQPTPLSDAQRRLIHDLSLQAREHLMKEARDQLEGVYGLNSRGRLEPPDRLPQVQSDRETADAYRLLARHLEDERSAGIPPEEVVAQLVKEVAFTHLNRLVAFKMMEARRLIRGTVDRGADSNAFKFYLADPEHADDLERYQRGQIDDAYRHFLLWQAGQVAQEVRVLFDPHTLASRLFPRPRVLNLVLGQLNNPLLAEVWRADETIGWVYQYFSEPEREEWGQRRGEKVPSRIVPLKSQLYTPDWVVRLLVQNTLGRIWVGMHPNTHLLDSDLLGYLVPLAGDVPSEPMRPIGEVTLLDPACGTMHFGLVAFDLLAEMYREELERAGEPGWPERPSVSSPEEIPASIISRNLFGIDIDLRAVQLSALALYLKAKSLQPAVRITDSNLACADVLPVNGSRLGTFLREQRFTWPIYERLIRALWARLQGASEVGSLLRVEREMDVVFDHEVRRARSQLLTGFPAGFENEEAEREFRTLVLVQITQALDEFARRHGDDATFFTGEAVKGVRLLNILQREYDVVVTNPPYLDSRDYNDDLKQ